MHWSWQRSLIVPAAQAVPEALILYAYILVLTPPSAAGLGFGALLLLFVPGAWAGEIIRTLSLPAAVGHGLLLGTSLVVLPSWWLAQLLPFEAWHAGVLLSPVTDGRIAMDAMLVTGGLGLAVWCRGLWLGAVPATTGTLTVRFLVGSLALIALAILLALASGTGTERYEHTLQLLVLGYFILAPTMLALTHLHSLRDPGETARPASLAWVVALVVPMGLVVTAGLLLTNDLVPVMSQAMHLAVQAFLLAAAVLRWMFGWLLDLLGALLAWLRLDSHGALSPVTAHRMPPLPQVHAGALDESAGLSGYLLVIPAAVLLVVFAWLLARNVRPRAERPAREERSSLWSWVLFRRQVRTAWEGWVDRLRPHPGPDSGQTARAKPDAAVPTDIRGLYRALLRWAAAHGHPRHQDTTPRELQRTLVAAAPQAASALALITDSYEQVRYGEDDLPPGALAAAAERLAALQSPDPPSAVDPR